jgi:hypothetical protein
MGAQHNFEGIVTAAARLQKATEHIAELLARVAYDGDAEIPRQ